MTVEERDVASQATQTLKRLQHVAHSYEIDTRKIATVPETVGRSQANVHEQDTQELATVPEIVGRSQADVYEQNTQEIAAVPEPVQRRKRQPLSKKQRYIVVVLCLLLTVAGTLVSAFEFPVLATTTYHQTLALALGGAQKLQTGITLLETLAQHPFDTQVVNAAQQNFSDALTDFNVLNDGLAFVPDEVRFAPAFGGRLHGAKHLASLAVNAAEGGLAACAIVKTLTSALHNPLDTTPGAGLTPANMEVVNQNIQQLKVILDQTIQQVNQLGPEDLQFDPRLGKLLHSFQTRLPLIQQTVREVTALFPDTVSMLLGVGKPAHYLIEILDSGELRPGGGFVGNYGILTLTGGRATPAPTITDTYLLDQPFIDAGHINPWPEAYSWYLFTKHGWTLRDSDFDADFPTSARNGEMLYKLEGGTLPLAGVIAITPAFVSAVLTLTGPISVPEYHETVTAQNFVDRIHYYQSVVGAGQGVAASADGNSSQRKRFTALLGKYLLDSVRAHSSSLFPQLAKAIIDSIRTKNVQIYFNADPAEKLLQAYHLDNSIQSPAGDSIFLVDANTATNKANRFIVTSMNDRVTVDTAGNAIHHAVIKFNWTASKLTTRDFLGPARYRDYLRVYTPPKNVLLTYNGWDLHDIGTLFGRRYWGGRLEVPYPVVGTITLTWSAPHAATYDAQGWHYRYLIQHQAGTQETIDLGVTFPSCAAIFAKSTGVVSESNQQVHLTQLLSQDTNVSVDYTC